MARYIVSCIVVVTAVYYISFFFVLDLQGIMFFLLCS